MSETAGTLLCEYFTRMLQAGTRRMIFSKPMKNAAEQSPWQKAELRQITDADGVPTGWQITRYTVTQAFHENLPAAPDGLVAALVQLTEGRFGQVNGFAPGAEFTLLLSRKGSCTLRTAKKEPALPKGQPGGTVQNAAPTENAAPHTGDAHNRKKHYLLQEGDAVPPLVDMGVFTPDGRVVKAMYDKFRQINRFLEIIDDTLRDAPPTKLNIIDFGCGKSYLTFLVYHYLTAVRGIRVQMIGLDLKEQVIRDCEAAARRYGYEGLHFELGNIDGYTSPWPVDMVLTLHACDTATDAALFNALQWNARMIFSVPCCQHELNGQIAPTQLTLLSRYGILQDRFCAIATDAVRARLLEACGYRTQLLEFIDFAHTPKNILIRAVRRPGLRPGAEGANPYLMPAKNSAPALAEVRSLCSQFGFTPALVRMLGLEKELCGQTEGTE